MTAKTLPIRTRFFHLIGGVCFLFAAFVLVTSLNRRGQGPQWSEKELQLNDFAVLESVLTELTSTTRTDLPFSLHSAAPRDIYFCTGDPGGAPEAFAPLGRAQWPQKSEIRRADAHDAAYHLLSRSEQSGVFNAFDSDHIAVHVIDQPKDPWDEEGKLTEEPIDSATNPIYGWAPGYTQDGSVAVLHLAFPEYHFAIGTFVLVKEGTDWHVIIHTYVQYL